MFSVPATVWSVVLLSVLAATAAGTAATVGKFSVSFYRKIRPDCPCTWCCVHTATTVIWNVQTAIRLYQPLFEVESSWNVMAHGDAREGKWRGNWRKEWVASTIHTTSEHGVSSITTADAHTSAASSRLNWRPSADLNELVRFSERRNLVSARVPSHFKRSLPPLFWATHANFSGSRCFVSGSWHRPHWRGRTVPSTSPSPSTSSM